MKKKTNPTGNVQDGFRLPSIKDIARLGKVSQVL
jgi:hypothetical protein